MVMVLQLMSRDGCKLVQVFEALLFIIVRQKRLQTVDS